MAHDDDHDPNRRFVEHPDAEHWSGHFQREGRDVWEHRDRLLGFMELRPGMTVMDLGAGTGAFTELVLERVGSSGRVHAIEIVEHFVERLEQIATAHPNLSVHESVEGVPTARVDLVICIDTYHHLEAPTEVMGAAARVLAPGGRLLFVDLHVDEHSPPGRRAHVRADRDTAERELEAAGFTLEQRLPDLDENYVSIFRAR